MRLLLRLCLAGLVSAYGVDVDDECASPGEPCALSVLQMHRRPSNDSNSTPSSRANDTNSSAASASAEAESEVTDPKVTRCEDSSMCEANRTCVFKEDKTWSQCVPLDDKTFQSECRFWDRKMRIAAIKATKILCDSVKCEWDQDCAMGSICVSKPDGSWAQCVPLAQDAFEKQCVIWEDDFRLAAIRATHFNCPNTRCYSQDWCVHGARCALTANGDWGQCIVCQEKSFQTNCYSWRQSFISAAESACHRKCLFDEAFEDENAENSKEH
ncbi:unnamed protein product [Durusdinium trenchii]|uniref:Uncharacterized protein n=2 Tax=Durusdinium trenchii TaxID=1381693 RepID=A0ABP0PEK8_9DINO